MKIWLQFEIFPLWNPLACACESHPISNHPRDLPLYCVGYYPPYLKTIHGCMQIFLKRWIFLRWNHLK